MLEIEMLRIFLSVCSQYVRKKKYVIFYFTIIVIDIILKILIAFINFKNLKVNIK